MGPLYNLKVMGHSIPIQWLITTEFTEEEYLRWAANILEKTEHLDFLKGSVHYVLAQSPHHPHISLAHLKFNGFIAGVIAYTSSLEYFLIDTIRTCLQTNSSLRKNGFSEIKIPAQDILDYRTIENLIAKYIIDVSNSKPIGELFGKKYEKVARFLQVEPTTVTTASQTSIDSIYEFRNLVAHTSWSEIRTCNIINLHGVEITYDVLFHEGFYDFVIQVIEIILTIQTQLERFYELAIGTWPEDQKIIDLYFDKQ